MSMSLRINDEMHAHTSTLPESCPYDDSFQDVLRYVFGIAIRPCLLAAMHSGICGQPGLSRNIYQYPGRLGR